MNTQALTLRRSVNDPQSTANRHPALVRPATFATGANPLAVAFDGEHTWVAN